MSASIETDLIPDVPSPRDIAAGALFLRGPEELIVSWALIGAFAILSTSVGLIFMLIIVPLALFMITVGFVWLLISRR